MNPHMERLKRGLFIGAISAAGLLGAKWHEDGIVKIALGAYGLWVCGTLIWVGLRAVLARDQGSKEGHG